MQALLLYAMFGSMLAALAGIVVMSVDTTQQFIQNQRTMTLQYFRNVEHILTEVVSPREMQIPPYSSCPGSGSASGITAYLCQREVAQLAEWAGSSGGLRDTWGNPIRGYALRRNVPIYAEPPNYNVVVPVTAIVLVSAGPDGRVDATTQSRLSALSSSSELRDVLSIGAIPAGECTPDIAAGVSCDDIVYTFSDQRALERRWQGVENAVNRIAGSALRDYQLQFRRFLPQLASIYALNASSLFDANGNIIMNKNIANMWQKQGLPGTPSLASINFADVEDRTRAGVDAEFRYITDNPSLGGSGLRLAYTVGSTPHGLNDMLTIRLENNNSPWGTGSGKTINYRKQVYAIGTP